MHGDDRLFAHIAKVYDAALAPEEWPAALADLAAMFKGSGAVLECNDYRRARFPFFWTAGIPEQSVREYQAHYFDNPRVRFGKCLPPPGVLHEPLFITEREMDRDPYYSDFLASYDLRYALASVIDNKPAITTAIAVQRPPRSGPPTEDEIARFAPVGTHYRRVLKIAAHLQRESGRGRALLDTLDHVATAIMLVGADASVALTNAAADLLLAAQDGLASRRDGLTARNVATTGMLRRAIARAASGIGTTLRLPRASGRPLVAEIFPVGAESAVQFGLSDPAVGIMVVDPFAVPAIDPARLALALAVGHKEAALAAALASGRTLADVASAERESLDATRKRLYRLFDKLGVRSQKDLVAIVVHAAFPR